MTLTHTFTITESERQVIVLALARLGLERPGWEPACIVPLVRKISDQEMYESFKESNAPPCPPK